VALERGQRFSKAANLNTFSVAMARKRARDQAVSESEPENGSDVSEKDSDDGVDIFSSLTGSRNQSQKISRKTREDEDEDEDDEIRASQAKSNRKQGTEMLKKLKGKSHMSKGEVGGGSFQSMGQSHTSPFFAAI
jgi:ATP-dependent RNA helicase DDX54/DBP10